MAKKESKFKIGLMQGRLTPSLGRGVQFVPHDEWKDEFNKAPEIGLRSIELNFDLEKYNEHHFWTESGRKEIKKLSKETGVKVSHLSLDFFMRRPFFRTSEKERRENISFLKKILKYANELRIKNVEIPLLDNSSIKTESEKKLFIDSIKECLEDAEKNDVNISLETDLEPKEFLNLVEAFGNDRVKVVYDTGNSAALGHNPEEEISILGKHFSNVHIKDRLKNAGTVKLGTGNTDFNKVFESLKKINYAGDFILQAARGDDHKEIETISQQKEFVQNLIDKYLR